MPPLKNHIAHTSSSRLIGGIFISAIFPAEIRAGLTIVNNLAIAISMRQMEYNHERIKQGLINSFIGNYKRSIFPAIKQGDLPVNKIGTFLAKISPLTTQNLRLIALLTYYPINALADYRIAALTNCHIIKLSLPPKKYIS